MLSLPVWQPGPKFLLGHLYPWSQVPYIGVSVKGSLSRRSLSRGSLSRWALCPGGSLSRGSLSRGSLSRWALCPGGSLSRGSLSGGGPCPVGFCPGGFCPEGFLYDIVFCLAPRRNVGPGGPLSGRSPASRVSIRETASPDRGPPYGKEQAVCIRLECILV